MGLFDGFKRDNDLQLSTVRDSFVDTFDEIFNQMNESFRNNSFVDKVKNNVSYPKVDVYILDEDKFTYNFLLAVPGCRKEDISVTTKKSEKNESITELRVYGKMNEVYNFAPKVVSYNVMGACRELKHSEFNRVFHLQTNVFDLEAEDGLVVTLEDGLLHIKAKLKGHPTAKKPPPLPEVKRIEIK